MTMVIAEPRRGGSFRRGRMGPDAYRRQDQHAEAPRRHHHPARRRPRPAAAWKRAGDIAITFDPPCGLAFDKDLRVLLAQDVFKAGARTVTLTVSFARRDAAFLARQEDLDRAHAHAGRAGLVRLHADGRPRPQRHRHGRLAGETGGQTRRRAHGRRPVPVRRRHAGEVLGREPLLRRRLRAGEESRRVHRRALRQVRHQRRPPAQVLLPQRPDGHRRPSTTPRA